MSKINVIHVGTAWKPKDNPNADPLYTIHIEGMGEPQKTFDASLAVLGEHEAESFPSKGGKTYWRTPKKQWTKRDEQFKADPDSRESIEWQTSLKAAVEVVRDYHMTTGPGSIDLKEYCKLVDKAAVHFKNLINVKPTSVTTDEEIEDTPEDAGDFAKINPVDDKPPLDSYEGM